MILFDLFFVVVGLALLFNKDKAWRTGGAFGLALGLGWLVQDAVTLWWHWGFWPSVLLFLVVSVGSYFVAVDYANKQADTPPPDTTHGDGH